MVQTLQLHLEGEMLTKQTHLDNKDDFKRQIDLFSF